MTAGPVRPAGRPAVRGAICLQGEGDSRFGTRRKSDLIRVGRDFDPGSRWKKVGFVWPGGIAWGCQRRFSVLRGEPGPRGLWVRSAGAAASPRGSFGRRRTGRRRSLVMPAGKVELRTLGSFRRTIVRPGAEPQGTTNAQRPQDIRRDWVRFVPLPIVDEVVKWLWRTGGKDRSLRARGTAPAGPMIDEPRRRSRDRRPADSPLEHRDGWIGPCPS